MHFKVNRAVKIPIDLIAQLYMDEKSLAFYQHHMNLATCNMFLFCC